MHKAYLLTGANLGDRQVTLRSAAEMIATQAGRIVQMSSLYETEPWGEADQPSYLNQALEIETLLGPHELMAVILKIEKDLGRSRRSQWESRPIDIDILFYDDLILDTAGLTIPHPRIQLRNFVLIPMLEIAPELMHPVFQKTIETLYEESTDELEVVMFEI